MIQYIVLMPISPDTGPLIRPAAEGEPPTVIDADVLFASPSEMFTAEERAKILIDKGAIVPADEFKRQERAKAKAAREAESDIAQSTNAPKE
jgi:hypothetical protein